MAFNSSQRDELFELMMGFSSRQLFASHPVSELFEENKNAIINEINKRTENEILNISVEDYAEYFESTYTIDFPILEENNFTISSFEIGVPASRFPIQFAIVDKYSTIPRDIIVFHVPFSGNINVLNYQPSTINLSAVQTVKVDNKEILFQYINFYDKPETIKLQFEADFDRFKRRYNLLKNDIISFNKSIKQFSINTIENKRNTILKKNNFLSSFNIPLKTKADAATTFTAPSPKLKKKIVLPPVFKNSQYKPDPTLDRENYLQILKIINDVGKNFERMPNTYKNKKEEDLRDHIILTLDPNFQFGSATGETFNKKGKTDIMLRYDSSVIFIAECKFWTGVSSFHETIDQLLGYLTWRDTKTAIVVFVKNKDISAVVKKVRAATTTHSQIVKFVSEVGENWNEYLFSLPDDSGKNITLTILLFHLPKLD